MAHEYYFDHHRVEAKRNFGRLVASLVIVAVTAVAVGTPAFLSQASSSTTTDLDGVKIDNSGVGGYGGSTTGPYAGATVTVRRVTNGAINTRNVNPFYFLGLASTAAQEHYNVSISPVTVGNYTLKGLTWCIDTCAGFNPQVTNFRTGSSTDFILTANHSYHMRWIYQPVVPPPTPPPTVAPTPHPVGPTPVPTQTVSSPNPPSGGGGSGSSGGGSSGGGGSSSNPGHNPAQGAGAGSGAPASSASVPDTIAPTIGGNFQALVAADSATITLSWDAATDNVAVKSYHLERSTDNSAWTDAATDITSLTYLDEKVNFGLHYFYRLSALDTSGNVSGYATVEAKTADFVANSTTQSAGNYMSDDKIVSVDVPAGTFNADATCSIVVATTQLGSVKRPVLAGPYALVCKDATGSIIDSFNKPVTWSFGLASKIVGFSDPGAISVDSSGGIGTVKGAKYNSKTQILQLSQTGPTTLAVLGTVNKGLPINMIIIIVVILLLIAGVVILVLRKTQRQNYNDYLRSKYYNL
jgi:uncharacterized membrane protein YgcG